jgi:thymidylate synthase (FAD)
MSTDVISTAVEFTKRPVNQGAEKYLYNPLPVLNGGYVTLVDYLGTDTSIANAARVSYNQGSKGEAQDKKLINYLLKNKHTSPFEQCVLTFECKMPIFVAREWVRHRTARLNEMSGRYTQLPFEVYTPNTERIMGQSKTNKQGSEGVLSDETRSTFLYLHEENVKKVYADYEAMIEAGVAKEVARIDLPLSIYTKWVWQCDLHNLLHFLRLRMDSHAQWEIRQYADSIAEIVRHAYPAAWEAFEENVLQAVTFSGSEAKTLADYIYASLPLMQRFAGEGCNPDAFKDVFAKLGIGRT